MKKDEIFQVEKENLEKTINSINRQIEIVQNNFKRQQNIRIGFSEGKRGTQFTRQSFMSLYATQVNDLKKVVNNPYFGKFTFKENGNIKDIYIGKKGVTDEFSKHIAYDWRSPVCSVYYDYGIGSAEYKVNNEIKKGEILNKRQIYIKNGKLEKVEEEDVISNDTILLNLLKENSNARLKSIIATIQREQNKIIRSPLKDDYIIQGVAGSGKTTVALHRIAYLLYNEAKNINESEFMILGPNKYFLNYISELLPDLDIDNVSQLTFEEMALKNINSKLKIKTKSETLKNVLSNIDDKEVIKYKSSINFMKLIEEFVDSYMASHLKGQIVYEGLELCTEKELKSIYDNSKYYAFSDYKSRIDSFIKRITKRVKDKKDDLSHEIWDRYRLEYLSLKKGDPRRDEIIDITSKIENNIKKGCNKQIKDFFKFSKVNMFTLYKAFIENIDLLDCNSSFLKQFKIRTLENLKNKKADSLDLAAMLLMSYIMNGSIYSNYKHIIIDEAQDLSEAEYYVLKKIFDKANFDIYGDINQSIYDYESIKDWNKLNVLLFEGKAKYLELNKSYRTTMQISNTSNLVLDSLNNEKTDCVSRMGNDIKISKLENNDYLKIVEQVNDLLKANYETIAIICKDDNEAKNVYNKLKRLNLNINLIKEDNDIYYGGITVVPSYLSKGLEFDAVILYNANFTNYQDNNIDQKLLYVGITRAMHDLYINFNDEISNSLSSLIKKDKTKKLEK